VLTVSTVLGKSSCTVLNHYYGSDTPIGWSPRLPPAMNAYVRGGETSGSSTGSAIGLSAGFCAGALGQETSNSIVSCFNVSISRRF